MDSSSNDLDWETDVVHQRAMCNAECSSRPVMDKEMNNIENKTEEINMNGNIPYNHEGCQAVAMSKQTSCSQGI